MFLKHWFTVFYVTLIVLINTIVKMKRALLFFICCVWFSLSAQIDSEIYLDTIAVQTEEELPQFYQDDLPAWYARRFRLNLGVFFPLNNTQVRVGNNNGNLGTTIDLEDDLGFTKTSASFMADFQWRISRRSRLVLEYFYLRRESSYVLDREIEFGDNTYPIDAAVTAYFDTNIARLAYSYAILSKPKYEAGLLIGAHVVLGDMGLQLDTNIGSVGVEDDFSFTAPLPDIGAWGEFVLSPKFGLYTNINYLALKVDNIRGRIISYNLSVLYNVYHNLSLTAGYTGLNIRVDVEKERLNGFFKWGYNGPSLTVTYTFGNRIRFLKK